MLRRDFFGRFFGGGAFLGLCSEVFTWKDGPRAKFTEENPLIYRGWKVFWTGWKTSCSSTRVAGQWLAWPPNPEAFKFDGRLFVSSVPGRCHQYRRGEEFWIDPVEGQILIVAETPKHVAETEVCKGLERLKKLLDSVPRA